MEPVSSVSGRAMPLDRSDVDTDQIIPAVWLKRIERSGFGAGLFSQWREDPQFVLNLPQYAGAEILVAGPNFGVGSSREHAVWALVDYGIKAVVAPRFGDIFRNNSVRSGLVTAQVDPEFGRALLDAVTAQPSLEVTVDVAAREVTAGAGLKAGFAIDAAMAERLLSGLDDIGLTLRHEEAITAYESTRPAWMPRVPSLR